MTEPKEAAPWAAGTVAALARTLYGLDVRARPLPSEYDQVFELTLADDSARILKVMHPEREAAFVELQCRTLDHLARHAPALRLPRVIPTVDGAPFRTVLGPGGAQRIVWLLSYVPGRLLFDVHPHSAGLLRGIGGFLGTLDRALAGFSHPAARRAIKWNLAAPLWIRDHLDALGDDPSRRALVAHAIDRYVADVEPRLPGLRRGVIYGDANDYNVLVETARFDAAPHVGVIDFGDMHEGVLVAEPAVAAAYALLGKEAPLAAAAAVVAGYHHALPLGDDELAVLYPLIAMRLAVSVVNSAVRHAAKPDDPYVTISEAPAWAALARLDGIHPRRAEAVFRAACGLAPLLDAGTFAEWLRAHRSTCAAVVDVDVDVAHAPPCVLDLGIGSTLLGADPAHDEAVGRMRRIGMEMARCGSAVGIGRHDEVRHAAGAVASIGVDGPVDELRTVHLGVELFLRTASPVHAPLAGTLHAVVSAADGARVIVRHEPEDAPPFFTLYQPIERAGAEGLQPGQAVPRDGVIGHLRPPDAAAGGLTRLHFQLARDLIDEAGMPWHAPVAERAAWNALSPDPNLLLGIPEALFPHETSAAETLERRQSLLGASLSVSYRRPLKIVRGWRQYLYDDSGRPYLDMFNNVPLIGHSHPRVVDAVCRQLGLLNTNTRYLHDTVLEYAERLTALLPAPLSVCYFVNSGSEANELAIRLARTHTRAEDMLVLENAYHGNTGTVMDISPYKFNGPGGGGRKPWVHVAPVADDYRGPHRRGEPNLGARYARDVAAILERMHADGRKPAAFIAESMPSVGGQILFPDGYLDAVYMLVRAAGGVCIADEVQVGFGRLGSAFWGFQTQHVVPDIVVLAKPIGNCFPLAAVVTTPEIAASFHNGMEFFSTYGGNPVSCAAGLAVLDVLRDENLPAQARRVGDDLLAALRGLAEHHPMIGDVRGMGLFQGIDLVTDRSTREPATALAGHVVNRLRERGVLAGTDGPFHNVIKLRPPLILDQADADRFVAVLDDVLGEDAPA